MSSRSLVRLSICSLCAIVMALSGLTETLLAKQLPPPPPGGKQGQGDGVQDGGVGNPPGAIRRNRRGRPGPPVSSKHGTDGEESKPKKFDELLAEKDLSRFRGYENEQIGDGWEIDGKYLHYDGSGGGDIITRDEYDNFELQFEYKISEGGNSGVLFRVSLGDDYPYMSGPEFQVLDDENHADGKNDLTSAGSLYAMYAPENKKLRAAGSWNEVRLIVNNDSITHYLNGVKVLVAKIGSDDWNDRLEASKFKDWEKYAKNSRGHIAFQDHGDEVWYRNIRIKQLTEETAANDRSNQSDGRDTSLAEPPAGTRRSGNSASKRPKISTGESGSVGDKDKDKGKKDK